MEASERTAAVFFVGNRLMLDDGVGPAAYDEILAGYDIPENVTLVDVGCMSLDMLPYVERCDLILTVDAVDGTGDAPGTVYRFEPDAMAHGFLSYNISQAKARERTHPGPASCPALPFRSSRGRLTDF